MRKTKKGIAYLLIALSAVSLSACAGLGQNEKEQAAQKQEIKTDNDAIQYAKKKALEESLTDEYSAVEEDIGNEWNNAEYQSYKLTDNAIVYVSDDLNCSIFVKNNDEWKPASEVQLAASYADNVYYEEGVFYVIPLSIHFKHHACLIDIDGNKTDPVHEFKFEDGNVPVFALKDDTEHFGVVCGVNDDGSFVYETENSYSITPSFVSAYMKRYDLSEEGIFKYGTFTEKDALETSAGQEFVNSVNAMTSSAKTADNKISDFNSGDAKENIFYKHTQCAPFLNMDEEFYRYFEGIDPFQDVYINEQLYKMGDDSVVLEEDVESFFDTKQLLSGSVTADKIKAALITPAAPQKNAYKAAIDEKAAELSALVMSMIKN